MEYAPNTQKRHILEHRLFLEILLRTLAPSAYSAASMPLWAKLMEVL
jgi:hypothetical protein